MSTRQGYTTPFATRILRLISQSLSINDVQINPALTQLLGQRSDGIFFGTLKKELIHHEQYETRVAARRSLLECDLAEQSTVGSNPGVISAIRTPTNMMWITQN